MSLYTDLIHAGLEVEGHESDLYVRVCPASQKVIAQHPEALSKLSVFESGKRLWYDIPFEFDPFWQSACS